MFKKLKEKTIAEGATGDGPGAKKVAGGASPKVSAKVSVSCIARIRDLLFWFAVSTFAANGMTWQLCSWNERTCIYVALCRLPADLVAFLLFFFFLFGLSSLGRKYVAE